MNVKTNAEKEWLRKLTTGKAAEKKEKKTPQSATVQTEAKLPVPGVVRTVLKNDIAKLSED